MLSQQSFLAAGLLASVAPVHAYWRMSCPGTLVTGRLDPIVTPGQVSGHTHIVLGGNGFAPTMDYDSTQKSTCTSCEIKGDNSNYWIPTLYYHAQDGSFESVPVSGGTVYYLQRASYPGKNVTAFPKGFRMTAGNPERRQYNNTEAESAISHVCLDYSGPAPVPEGPPLPSKNCPNGVRSQVFFPSCWDGVNLDSADHQSHMAYPSGGAYNAGTCPDSHPVPMISVFYEFIFGTDQFSDRWYGDKQPFVYSMGDDTGYGLHGDFLNGWDIDLLQQGIDMKTTQDQGCASEVTCNSPFVLPDVYGTSCTLPSLIDEQVTGKLAALPGCNPVTDNPVPSTNCNASKTLGITTSKIYTDVTSQGWGYLGCGVDDYYNRAMPTQLADSTSMTVETCIQMCDKAGYSLAGLEYASQCFCANTIPSSAQPIPNNVGNCNMACKGNSAETCGDANRLSIYKKCTGGTCSNAQFTLPGEVGSLGGSSGSTGSTGASATSGGATGGNSASSASSAAQSPSSSPSKAASSSSSAVAAAASAPANNGKAQGGGSNAAAASPSSAAPAKQSTAPSSASTSGGSSGSGSSVTLPSGWKSAGCYSDSLSQRALQGEMYAWWGQAMTASGCAQHCATNGFAIAGVENGGQCFCGNDLKGGSAAIDNSKCNKPCEGKSSETCGGALALNVYTKSNSIRRRAVRSF